MYLVSSDTNVVSGNTIHGESRQKSGITVGNSGKYADPTEITDNTITGHRENGIRLYRSCNTYVGLSSGSPVTVKKNTIGPDNEEAGIRVEYCACPTDNENRIAGNQISQSPYGISIAHSAGTRVEDLNEIAQNEKDGIYVTASERIELVGNLIEANDEAGIHLANCQAEAGKENRILENTIRQNEGHGIHLEKTRGTQIGEPGNEVNTIRLNTGNGVHVDQCTSSTQVASPLNSIINNVIKDDNNHGIYLTGSRFILIKENEVRANHKNGIHLKGSSFNYVYENEDVAENNWFGIYLSHNSQHNDIAGNRVVENKKAGIFLTDAHYNDIPKDGDDPNTIEENEEDGIRIDGGQGNVVRTNTIRNNQRDGMRLSDSHYNKVLGEITIQSNDGHGVYLERSRWNRLEGPSWVEVGVAAPDFVDYRAVIRDNDDYGIYFRDNSHANALVRYAVAGHGVCMRIDKSSYIKFEDDLFFSCNLGVRETDSQDNAYTLQRFEACHVPYGGMALSVADSYGTALQLENSSPQIEGCSFYDNEGDGIRSESGSQPAIRGSNIHGNAGIGLNNLDPSVTIEARDNWWGAANGPGGEGPGDGDEISGTVDFAGWRPVTVTLVAVAREDPLLAARGSAASNQVRVRNWLAPTDTVTMTVTDSQGWLLQPGVMTLTLDADTSMPVTATIPSTASIGATNDVTVAVASQADPAITDTATFEVRSAQVADLVLGKQSPTSSIGQEVVSTIVVTNTGPDGASGVNITDTLPVTAAVLSATPDQGSCSILTGVVVCDLGSLAGGARASVALAIQANSDEGLYTAAEVSAGEYDPNPADNVAFAYTLIAEPAAQIYLPLVLRGQAP